MKEQIIKKLESMGYEVIPNEVVRNGVKKSGIIVKEKNKEYQYAYPVFYLDEMIKGEEDEAAVDKIVSEITSAVQEAIPFSMHEIFEKEYILKNIFIGLQRKSDEDILKMPYAFYPEIECYLYVKTTDFSGQEIGSYKLKEEHMKKIGVSKEELWFTAKANTDKESSILTIVLKNYEVDFVEEIVIGEDNDVIPTHILTNKTRFRGATALLNRSLLEQFVEAYNTKKIVVIPSSIHEVILLPYESEDQLKSVSQMVKEVNEQEVDPVDQLADEAFVISLEA